MAKNLTLMGIGRLILIDNDFVELSNLSRQMLFTDRDIGRPKASTASMRLREMNPGVAIDHYDRDVREVPEEIFAGAGVIASCLDSWGTRRWLNSLAVSLNKPMVDGGIDGLYGNVHVVIPRKTPCLECHGENLIPREERVAECTLRRRKPDELIKDLAEAGIDIGIDIAEELFRLNIKTIYDLKYTKLEPLTDGVRPEIRELILSIRERLKPKMPALQSVAAAVAAIMTTEIVKLLHRGALGRPATGLLVYDASSSRLSRVRLKRLHDCTVCGEVDEEPLALAVDGALTVQGLKEVIASKFGYPDPEVLYKKRRLSDGLMIKEAGIGNGDILYIATSRRHQPLPLRLTLQE